LLGRNVCPPALALLADLLGGPAGIHLLDLWLVDLHEEKVRSQGALGRIRVMRLALALATAIGGLRRSFGAGNGSVHDHGGRDRHRERRSADIEGVRLEECAREALRVVLGEERVEVGDVGASKFADAVLEGSEAVDKLFEWSVEVFGRPCCANG
jgi:hypothetical protein